MAEEIERKFLVASDAWRAQASGTRLRQGFLSTDPDRTVRVRAAGARGTLTIKGRTVGARRPEYEYEIPLADAEQMLDSLCEKPLIEKVRFPDDSRCALTGVGRSAIANFGRRLPMPG